MFMHNFCSYFCKKKFLSNRSKSLKYGRLKKYRQILVQIQFRPPIEIEWSLNFQASMPTLYVKTKIAEALLLPKEKGFLGYSRVFLSFQDLGILSKISLTMDPEVVPGGQ